MKTKTIPFDKKTANKVLNGEIKGKVMVGRTDVQIKRILCTDIHNTRNIVAVYDGEHGEDVEIYKADQLLINLEVPDEPQFKPFDKVLVRDTYKGSWRASIFSHPQDGVYACIDGWNWRQCIPYEGNEYLLATDSEPKGGAQ